MKIYNSILIPPLAVVVALLLASCGNESAVMKEDNLEKLMTQSADSLIVIESKQGSKSYRFEAALVESYAYAKEPYREFRKGIDIRSYADSTGELEFTLIADYAIYFENRKLWEAKGNIVATNADGQMLETQQLFWNQLTARIYSNVDSKITQGEDDVLYGVGFESDDKLTFDDWEFRRPRGAIAVDAEQQRDSTGRGGSDTTNFIPPSPVGVEGLGSIVEPSMNRMEAPKQAEPLRGVDFPQPLQLDHRLDSMQETTPTKTDKR